MKMAPSKRTKLTRNYYLANSKPNLSRVQAPNSFVRALDFNTCLMISILFLIQFNLITTTTTSHDREAVSLSNRISSNGFLPEQLPTSNGNSNLGSFPFLSRQKRQANASGGGTGESGAVDSQIQAAIAQSSTIDLDGANLVLASEPFDYHASMPVITKRELAMAIKGAAANVSKLMDALEPNLFERGQQVLELGSSGWLANALIHKATLDKRLLNLTQMALISEEATRQLARQYKLNWLQTSRGLPLISVDQTQHLGRACPRPGRPLACSAGQYRSLSGHCNNVQNPDWGAMFTALVRYAPARYADHVSRPMRSARTQLKSTTTSTHLVLPSARAISTAIRETSATSKQHSHLTTMLAFFAQLVAHDASHTSQYVMEFGNWTPLKCCGHASPHPECMAIELGPSYCLDYVRSLPASQPGCNLGPRDQLNLVSSYLDASWLYGSSEELGARLRRFSGGRLKTTTASTTGDLLPLIRATSSAGKKQHQDTSWEQTADECKVMAQLRAHLRGAAGHSADASAASCFQSGDSRVNENIGLMLMQTIWLREHNLIADKLGVLNKHWQDERLFQESRRIVIAQFQHIAYNELLPALLGHDLMQRFNLSTALQGYSQSYEPQINAGTSNEFSVSFGAFVRSLIPGQLERYGDRLELMGSSQILDTFMNGAELFKNKRLAQYLTGMISQNAMEPGQGLISMASNKMMIMDLDNEISRMSTGGNTSSSNSDPIPDQEAEPRVDLIALAIQEARDHGIRGYLYWREACQLKPHISTWEDLELVLPAGLVEKLKHVYANPLQLDLYVAQLESPLAGAAVGATLACIFARQFYHLKHGDRYWFENDLPAGKGSFSPAQLDEIRQSSLAKLLCRNSQNSLSFVQPSPLLASDPFLNAYQYCSNRAMSSMDLSKWQDSLHSAKQLMDEQLMNSLRQSGNLATPSLVAAASTTNHPVTSLTTTVETTGAHEPPSLGVRSTGRWQRSLAAALEPESLRSGLFRARRQLEDLAYEETRRMRAMREAATPAPHGHAGYRYLGRPKRQTLQINNQSLIFELATNELVRSLIHQGKDREQSQSLQSDIREFLLSLEAVQLDNLVDNSNDLTKLQELVSTAGAGFLTREQRVRLAQANDPTFGPDPSLDSTAIEVASATHSATNEPQCQDEERIFPCDHTSPFRTMTGWCNNLEEPKFGQSFTQHDRLLPNAYEDGLSRARQFSVVAGANGARQSLPSPRLISTRIHDDRSHLHNRYSLALMQFGQFAVDHDLTRTPFAVAIDGSVFDCSPCNSRDTVHRDCMPITIPDLDHHFHSLDADKQLGKRKRCLHFIRSLNGQTGLGPRQQLNALTSFIDASEVYGSDNCEAKSLRTLQGGRLNSTAYFKTKPVPTLDGTLGPNPPSGASPPKEILPITMANPECVTPGGFCFHAGDQRASEQPGLTAIHTMLMRFHNFIVGQLAQQNRHWNDERLYQQGRRILGAIMQRVTYNEFLPRLLGLDLMSRFDLLLRDTGYSQDYDSKCSAQTLNEFSAAAFRMGHSLIRAVFPLLDKNYKQIGRIQLRKAFFNSQRILTEPQFIDSIMRGVVTMSIENFDNSVSEELTNHLFEKPNQPFSGMDLISLNIQRARDHGLNSYNKYRQYCNLTRAKTFQDLTNEIPADLITRLQSVYSHVDDIDLFTGGLSELPVHGGLIGPTLGCIIGLQFQRLKRCDRFWHETDDAWVRFSPAQLAEIRKMLLSKIICSQSDAIHMIQRNAMDVSDNFQ